MKKILSLLLFVSSIAFSQAPPQGISHRGTVYNTSGVLVTGTAVKIRISILDNSATGSSVYQEIHSVTTNTQGQYSLNIGLGIPVSPYITTSFSTINWGTNSKFLKVEIDPTGVGTTYPVAGTNQLMSVPYALYANSTNQNSNVRIVNKINDLRSLSGAEDDIVYVKYHTVPWDGGGGFFTLLNNIVVKNNLGVIKPDNDGTVIVNQNLPSHRWVRKIDNYIDVRFFGTYGNFQHDDGLRIQKAIDVAAENVKASYSSKCTTVYIPVGNYKIHNTLLLKTGVSIKGDGLRSTFLTSGYLDDTVSPPDSNDGSRNDGYMMTMDRGRIEGCNISDISFVGGVSPYGANWSTAQETKTKGCMFFESVSTNEYGISDGGLWNCTFKNIRVVQFNGNGIMINGGQNLDFSRPNQFCVFENVTLQRQKDNVHSLLLNGQVGQFTFINSSFGGLLYSNATKALKGINCAITNNNSTFSGFNTSSVVTFLNCTFQDSEYGIFVKYSDALNIDNCWFENLDLAISVSDSDDGRPSTVNIQNSRFANAASFGSLPISNKHQNNPPIDYFGTCISSKGSNINVNNNFVTVSTVDNISSNKYFIGALDGNKSVRASGNTFLDTSLGKTYGITQNVSTCINNSIDLKGNNSVLLSLPTNQIIKNFSSTSMAGERIAIKINTPSVTINNTGNIRLGTNTTLTILYGKTLEFVKLDITEGVNTEIYQLLTVY